MFRPVYLNNAFRYVFQERETLSAQTLQKAFMNFTCIHLGNSVGVMLPRSSGGQAGFWMQGTKTVALKKKEDLLHRGEGQSLFSKLPVISFPHTDTQSKRQCEMMKRPQALESYRPVQIMPPPPIYSMYSLNKLFVLVKAQFLLHIKNIILISMS